MLSLQGKQGAQKLWGSRVADRKRRQGKTREERNHDDDDQLSLCFLSMCVGCGGRECVAWGGSSCVCDGAC